LELIEGGEHAPGGRFIDKACDNQARRLDVASEIHGIEIVWMIAFAADRLAGTGRGASPFGGRPAHRNYRSWRVRTGDELRDRGTKNNSGAGRRSCRLQSSQALQVLPERFRQLLERQPRPPVRLTPPRKIARTSPHRVRLPFAMLGQTELDKCRNRGLCQAKPCVGAAVVDV
jgi:hypothetical protein